MLQTLGFIAILFILVICHQLHIVCSDYSHECPSISSNDIVASIPMIKNVGKSLYVYFELNKKVLPLMALVGKYGYYLYVAGFAYYALLFILIIIKKVILLAAYLLAALIIAFIVIVVLISLASPQGSHGSLESLYEY
jgi:hypothetical protein